MKRRTRLIVKLTACSVIVASVVLARVLSEDGVVQFALGQAALFFAFAMSALTLFVVVVFDFDRWIETVPPVPKRVGRRVIRRGARRVGRVAGWVLACYGAVMTWVWSRVGGGLGWLVTRSAATLAWFWSLAVRFAGATLVLYRGVLQRVWVTTGRAFASTLVHVGDGLTVLWIVLVRGGLRALVVYRAGMHWLWSVTARVVARALAIVGAALTVLGAAMARAGAWSLVRCGRGIKRLWWAAVGRGDEPTPKPIRRWYTATVDAAFGIPPDNASVDVFGGRAARHVPASTDRPRAPRGPGGETVGAGGQSDVSQRGG